MAPPLAGKRSRNRLSLILQFASPFVSPDSSPSKLRSVSSPTTTAGPSVVSPVSGSSAGVSHTLKSYPSLPSMSMRSTTSTSRRPMSPTSVYEDVWDMSRVPPTTNELDAEEKRRRLKKARKLSQILGELPTEYGDEEKRDAGAADVGGPGVKASKRLSWSAIQVTGHPLSADIAHPLSTRPSLHLLTRTMSSRSPHASTRPTPTLSPVVDARTSSHFTRPSLDASVRSMPSSERGLESASRVSSSSQRSESRRRNGRPARATRPHDVPDLPSPVPGALSPLDGPSDPWEPPVSPRSPLANDKWRRKSMDASSARSSVHSSKASAHGEAPSVKPRRSKSLWSKKSGKSEGSEEGTGAVESEEAFRSGPISGKQRSLSVRRGRKLAQLLGSEPPLQSYVVPSIAGQTPLSPDHRRDSVATFLSVTSNDLLPIPSPRPSNHASRSSISSIASEPPSPAPHVAVHPSRPRKSESDHRGSLPPFAPAAPRDRRSISISSTSPRGSSEDSAAFRQRRLRAAKLSRFFGVTYTDLAQSLPPLPSARTPPVAPTPPRKDVDVQIEQGGGFWNRSDVGPNVVEADMNDVIMRLRQMKA